jgi:predicted  nucleic acid-binding Zn-ribbon protein
MAAPDLPDFDELAVELVQLRHREQSLARALEREQERHVAFGSEYSQRKLEALRAELEPLRAEIAVLEDQLRPVLRRREE